MVFEPIIATGGRGRKWSQPADNSKMSQQDLIPVAPRWPQPQWSIDDRPHNCWKERKTVMVIIIHRCCSITEHSVERCHSTDGFHFISFYARGLELRFTSNFFQTERSHSYVFSWDLVDRARCLPKFKKKNLFHTVPRRCVLFGA